MSTEWIVVGVVAVGLVGYAISLRRGRGSATDARAWVEAGALLVDVRTPGEFRGGHLDGAKNIPLQGLEGRLGEIGSGRKGVGYCHSGMRSRAAAGVLRRAGHEVLDLGPMTAWR